MPIFNSLGSSYNLKYVLKSLSRGKDQDSKDFKNYLEQKYNGEAILLYKGREALTLALNILKLPKDSRVAINGFTCVAVFKAIRKAGFEPFCLDLEETEGLNFTAKTLAESIKNNKKIKAVVVQNTFGYPCDIETIQKLCQRNNLTLIEDLAHCVGTNYPSGKEAGTVGDFVVLSLSQDKIIDAVSGGALVIRNKKFANIKILGAIERHLEGVIRVKDRMYPLETYKIRLLYKFGIGKPYHFLLKKLNLLSNVMNESFYEYYSLPNWNASLALYQFKLLEAQLSHRKKNAKIYFSNLPRSLLIYNEKDMYDRSSNLRFPIIVGHRRDLLDFLKKKGIHLSDVWYTDVATECPVAIGVSKKILNLPTHINVSEHDAIKICELINKWLKLQ